MKKSSLPIILSLLSSLSASPLLAKEETDRDWLDRGDARTFMAIDVQKGIVEGGAGMALENFRQAVDCYVKAGENGAPTRDYWARFPAAIIALSSLSPAEATKEADKALAFMGNSGDDSYLPDLAGAMENLAPTVRAHVAWAMGRLGGNHSKAILEEHAARERDPAVLQEITWACEQL